MCLTCVCAGEKWLYGCWFYRPTETFHLATRKFLEKEVFKSDYYNKVAISKVLGKCLVMFVKVGAPTENNAPSRWEISLAATEACFFFSLVGLFQNAAGGICSRRRVRL